jgi:DNA-binding transcriptional regulator YhcF (GntR family)
MNSRRPRSAEVRAMIHQITESAGRPPSVLAVAAALGLSNTTFRRNYPELVTELQDQRRQSGTSTTHTDATDRYDRLRRDNAVLRSRNSELTNQLELAAATIQRLAIENEQLRHQLEEASRITRLDRRSLRNGADAD